MSAMSDAPDDLPDDTAVNIEWDRDMSGGGQDPERVTVIIGPWEWKSMQKRKESEWTVDGIEVRVKRGRDSPGLMLETSGGDVEAVETHLTPDQFAALREHKRVQFEDSRTFPFDVVVVVRNE